MAAQDYFGSAYPSARREDAPLPPVPSRYSSSFSNTQHQQPVGVSPPGSPFNDNAYPSYPNPSQQSSQQNLMNSDSSYHGYGGYGGRPDPFGDANAIPLQNKPGKDSHELRISQDPEGYGQRPERGRRDRGRKQKGDGWFRGKIAWVVYTLTIVQFAVFIGEIVRNSTLTGSPIEINPTFNPMIGPSPYVLINMGARYVPCMRNQEGIQSNKGPIAFPCPNTTSTEAACSLSDLCGFNGVPNPNGSGNINQSPQPNQWWRFIVPMFMHAGIIHIGFNMLLQMTLGRDIEREIGSVRFALVYFASGIFGFVFGGNFSPPGIAPVGASGSLFGIFALTLLSLLYTWKQRRKPVRDLCFIILDIVISFVLGLLPGLDNFSHIGGFLMGLVLGICILHSPNSLRKRTHQEEPPYTPMSPGDGRLNTEVMARGEGLKGFAKNPVGFFKGRVAWWWAWWFVRVVALLTVLVVFIVLLNNFYVYRTQCHWCKYLSCIDVNDWCDIGQLSVQNQSSKRDLGLDVFNLGQQFAKLDFTA